MAGTRPDPRAGPAGEPPSVPPAEAVDTGFGPRGEPELDSRFASDVGAESAAERSGRTWTVLIAALGGEGGGVLSNWLVDAAASEGRSVQATSVPGVAQRTGATTYYLEIGPRGSGGRGSHGNGPDGGGDSEGSGPVPAVASNAPAGESGDARAARSDSTGDRSPSRSDLDSAGAGSVMALLPTPGNVDLLVASELLEAGRAAQNGMITPDRTTVIASTHRTFAIAEKSAMGDGRFDDERIRRAVRELSRRHVLTDLGRVADRAGTVLSSVLLGAVAGSGALPIPRERLRAAIERAGIAVEANLRGFDAGGRLFDETDARAGETVSAGTPPDSDSVTVRTPSDGVSGATYGSAPHAARVEALPAPLREVARLGLERTVEYQDARYGALYLDRIESLVARRPTGGAPGGGDCTVAREVARQLALWMCFEDIVRVADLKTRRSRIERVRTEVRAKPGQPVVITEFLKPGVDEWCSLLPAWLARPILRAANRGGWRRRLNVGLHVRTSSVTGFLLLWTLARLKRLRRGMHRFVEEQARIETWIERVGEACATSAAFALEAAMCASLVKGYGDTHDRGVRSFERTMACLDACARARDPAASLRILREAALADPEGGRLDAAVAALHADAARVGNG